MKAKLFLFITLSTLIYSCKKNKQADIKGDWLIPKDEVLDGGPGKDGIPALENPPFTGASEANYLNDNSIIIGLVSGNTIKAYPLPILDWHEIINDNVNGSDLAINYCPLTGTGMAWNRKLTDTNSTFGVSGLLYNSNLILYDRESNSNWSQMRLECVNGSLIGNKAIIQHVIETSWSTWKKMYPNTQVVSSSTGHNRNYTTYPYGDYNINNSKFIFPVSSTDSRLPNKERVHGIIIDGQAKVYRFSNFTDSISIINDVIKDQEVIITGSVSKNMITSFYRKLPDGSSLTFNTVQDSLPVILKDNEGNRWDVFGVAVSGPRSGEKLTHTNSLMGYWFAWAAFYPSVLLY